MPFDFSAHQFCFVRRINFFASSDSGSKFTSWKLDETNGAELGIFAVREDEVPGTHTVTYHSEVDEININHIAYNRNGFALGAVIAAEWIFGKQGVFGMNDVLGL